MCRLIKLTRVNGQTFHLNADKIVSVHPVISTQASSTFGEVPSSTIYHEPYNRENALDYENVKETPEEIADKCALPATIIHIPSEDYR